MKVAEKEAKFAKGRVLFLDNENSNLEVRMRNMKFELQRQVIVETEKRRESDAECAEIYRKAAEWVEMQERRKGKIVNQWTQTDDVSERNGYLPIFPNAVADKATAVDRGTQNDSILDERHARGSQSSGSEQVFEDAVEGCGAAVKRTEGLEDIRAVVEDDDEEAPDVEKLENHDDVVPYAEPKEHDSEPAAVAPDDKSLGTVEDIAQSAGDKGRARWSF